MGRVHESSYFRTPLVHFSLSLSLLSYLTWSDVYMVMTIDNEFFQMRWSYSLDEAEIIGVDAFSFRLASKSCKSSHFSNS